MDSGLYVTYAGLLARSASLDNAASNLANTSTSGFRAQREFFHGDVGGDTSFSSVLGRSVNSYSVLGGNRLSLDQGQVSITTRPLDLAIEGKGFFGVSIDGKLMLTRNGDIRRSADGSLTFGNGGNLVSEGGKNIVVPPGEVNIGTDGVVAVDGYVIDKIAVFSAPASSLTPAGTARYLPQNENQLDKVAEPVIHQGALEASNQNEVQGSINLIQVERQSDVLHKALGIFADTLDKTAAQDLPRI